MANIINITDKPVRHTTSGKQDLRLAVDVSAFDELDLLLTVYEAGSAITVKIITGMQNETEEGWVDVTPSFGSTGAQGEAKINLKNFLRYVRYELTTSTNTTFLVNGIARRWA